MRIQNSYIETNDLSLASALLAIGIPFDEETPFIKTKSVHGEHYKFFFQEQSNCGKFNTLKMINAWNDPDYNINNPECPFAYIKCAFHNRDGLLDVVKKAVALIVIEKNGKLFTIREDATVAQQTKVFSQI